MAGAKDSVYDVLIAVIAVWVGFALLLKLVSMYLDHLQKSSVNGDISSPTLTESSTPETTPHTIIEIS